MKKAIVIGVLLVMASMSLASNVSNDNSPTINIKPLNMVVTTYQGNVQVTATPDNEIQPVITMDNQGRYIVAYIRSVSIMENYLDISYSEDGQTWTAVAEITTESGAATSPSIAYQPTTQRVLLSFLDPAADYPIYGFQIVDITDLETYNGIRWGWMGGENYNYVASGYVADWFLQLIINDEPDFGIMQCPTLAYWTTEWEQEQDNWGLYFDGQSILKTAPASYPDMATGTNRIMMVMQHDNETTGHSEIAYKMTVTDKDLLLTQGGGPGGMDKYSDIEVWPWQGYLGKGDFDSRCPSVSASGSNFVVVYMSNRNGNWDIYCSYSHDDGGNWSESVVANSADDEVYPAVYIIGNAVYCAFIKNGNLYLAKSEDGGATWGEPVKINDADGTVVEEPRAVDITGAGIVWVDARNGNKDIYYSPLPAPKIEISITGGFGVKATIANTGLEAAKNIDWSVDLSGLVFVGKHTEGTIDELAPGESVEVGPGFVFGFGPTTITVTAGGTTATASGFILGPLVLGV